ncbi:MAG: transposase [Lachnospiraceae bacterium]|nr:transposase [Lachnospiraceae bacterium]
MFKMLLVRYLYGVKSERRLVEEIQLNLAYRWFCGFSLNGKILIILHSVRPELASGTKAACSKSI